MAITISINGSALNPQPNSAAWDTEIVGDKLDGTESTGAFRTFRITAPKNRGQSFNWDSFENQSLNSITAFAPGDTPDGASVLYTDSVVSRKIKTYEIDLDRTLTGVEMEIRLVI